LRRAAALATALLALVTPAGCGDAAGEPPSDGAPASPPSDEPGPPQPDDPGPTKADHPDDGQGGQGGSSGAGAPEDDGLSRRPGEATCDTSGIDPKDDCSLCVASKCTDEAIACCQKPGCLDVVLCIQETGCLLDCYQPDKCKDAIDASGGLFGAIAHAGPLALCAALACPLECLL
jgi:hypothetical protein